VISNCSRAGPGCNSYPKTNIINQLQKTEKMKKIILIAATLAAVSAATAQPISGPLDICPGLSYTFTDTAIGGVWTSGTPSVAAVDSFTGVVTGAGPGVSVITYHYSGGGASSVTVTVHAMPAAITGTASVCAGATTTLADATTGGAWSSNNDAVAIVDDSTGAVVGISADTVSLLYTGAYGCSRSVIFTVNPTPYPITAASSYCTGHSDTLYDLGSGTWSTGTPSIASVGSASGVFSGIAGGVASVTYTLPTGCAIATTITVNPSPHAGVVTAADFVCLSNSITCTSDSCCGSWSSSNPAVATVGSLSGVVTGITAGLAIISYNVTNVCGTATAIKGVQVLSDGDCTRLSVKKEGSVEGQLSVMPNPAVGGAFTLLLSSGTPLSAQVIITNALGDKIKELAIEANKKTDVSIDGPAGVYLITAVSEAGKISTKVVVE
jgi:uncharacterized protein YjdB